MKYMIVFLKPQSLQLIQAILGLFCLCSMSGKAVTIDSLTFKSKSPAVQYHPPGENYALSNFEYPIAVKIGIKIEELRDLDIKNPEFYIGFSLNSRTPDTLKVTSSSDTFNFHNPFEFFYPLFPEHDRTLKPKWNPPVISTNDSLNLDWESYMETVLPHVWDMRRYPFDNQKLKVVIEGRVDTSIVKLYADSSLCYVNDDELIFIKDGLQVSGITSSNQYIEKSGIKDRFSDDTHKKIIQKLIFEINVDRKGSFLYFKLFLGGFLSFLISFLVYTISPKFFETRITLSLGGIFGAVGNKYFVENTMPNIQVLTKADIINNLVIVFIIINIFIVISQQTKSIRLGKLEENVFASRVILFLFITINTLIVLT